MLSLNFYSFLCLHLAIYMVAFLCDRKSYHFLITFFAAEFIGRFEAFQWALYYDYGAFMHLSWGVMYCYCLFSYYLHSGRTIKKMIWTTIATITLILFQVAMVIDCKWSEGNATILFNNYKIIVTAIHCCILFTFIKWRFVVAFVDEFIASIGHVIRSNGYYLHFWYTDKISKAKNGN